MRHVTCVLVVLLVVSGSAVTWAEFRPVAHKPLAPGAVAVTKPGNLDQPGATYQLMNDIVSDRTALFLARDVTVDLNGYTVTYAAGPYQHLPNGDFERDFSQWDTAKAPNAKIHAQKGDWPFVGKKVCRLPKGEEIVSSYVTLPVAERSYHAMVAMLSDEAPVTISVEDEAGKAVTCEHHVGDKTYKTCPISAASKLDGGCVYAHFRGVPAGKYRVRVTAGKEDLFIDQVDLRPSLDVGVAVADSGWVYTNYNQVAWGGHLPVLVDYLVPGSYNALAGSVANAKGSARVVIRNGVIRNGFAGMHSWGIVAKTTGVVELENLKMAASGINTNQAIFWGPKAVLRDCRFETDTPFIIERHNLVNSPVTLGAAEGAEVSHCEFIGGQGNLHVPGAHAKVHDNLFVNRQRVTNHYSLALSGASAAEVWNNCFEPEIGCSINVYRAKDCDIHHNTFHVTANDRSCEVYRGAGTVTGVRITDYDAKRGDEKGCWGNKVRENKFIVTGREYTTYEETAGRATAIFYSSGAGENYFTANEFIIHHENPGSKALATAFYIGDASYGCIAENNRITSNVPAFHIAAGYGYASNVVIRNNTFTRGPDALDDYQPIRMGYWKLVARNVEFRSNTFEGAPFGIAWGNTKTENDEKHSYSVWWTLTVKAAAGSDVVVSDKDGNEAFRGKTGADGTVRAELLEYKATAAKTGRDYDFEKTCASPYTVKVGAQQKTVTLDRNTEIAF